jgi:hypothetical protein
MLKKNKTCSRRPRIAIMRIAIETFLPESNDFKGGNIDTVIQKNLALAGTELLPITMDNLYSIKGLQDNYFYLSSIFLNLLIVLLTSILLTGIAILLSYVSYIYFEMYFLKLKRKFV